jgi:DNA topoisomerase-1
MSKNLVIVESPAKAKTIKKYLGPEFDVLASYGHVRDLVPKDGAVDTEHDFAMRYQVIDKSSKHVDAIRKAMRHADALYLATDPDREGEAISWHTYELLRDKGVLKEKPVHRVVFYEVTRSAVKDAVAHPRDLSMDLVNAQQARRALDYLVGFNLSPLLWRKVRPGLSAGRVQSPALRMICEREDEIERFEAREYWTVEADCEQEKKGFVARLVEYQGDKVEQFTITNEDHAREAEQRLHAAAGGWLDIAKVDKKQRKRNPAPPFTTSTLQQEAVRKLGFTARRTMRTAQQLYEGVDVGSGAVGLITYMRTDSVHLAVDAVAEIRQAVASRYGSDKLPDQARAYKTKAKNAQEAHEAIRPTEASRDPDSLLAHLSDDQRKLYALIWKRTMACQMIHATFDTVAVDLRAGDAGSFRANGSTIREPGFMAVYREGSDEPRKAGEDERELPAMEEGQRVPLLAIRPEQHFTEPPPRYTEASLVKTLEEYGIGRPSTYATIISTLLSREYVELESKRFRPTDVGRVVNGFLTRHFSQYVDYDFTARLEDDLDAVSRGEQPWVPLMRKFWDPFKEQVNEKSKVSREEVSQARTLGTDPKTGKAVSVRMGRYGPFAQMGTREDEEKPKFAGLLPGQRMDEVTLEEALALFQLPRQLGETADGEPVSANVGRFGPYVRYGDKFVSIREGDPYSITLEQALELIAEKKAADASRIIADFENSPVQILKGRYGPYITDGKKNARIPKGREPETLTLAECEQLLAEAPEKKARRKAMPKKRSKTGA